VALIDEIREQPGVVGRLIADGAPAIERIAHELRSREIATVVIAARGSSDHAAIYAQYVFGVRQRWPVGLAAPSILSLYDVEPRFDRALVIGISQSGASPDVVGVIDAARRQGEPTIALTNDPASPLAAAAEFVIDLAAGPERSIAATKTYTAELTAIALLSAALDSDPATRGELDALPRALAATLADEPPTGVAATLAGAPTCTVLGRGFEYATAREWALKLKELAGVVADPYSAADFQHGPIALVEPGSPVLVVAPSGRTAADLRSLVGRLVDLGAELVVLSDEGAWPASVRRLALPGGVAEWLRPIVSIVPAQRFALELAFARGRDPERPRHLTKVTATR
jgi:glucosamine--fructose-6-phosphate aminotransferase (isomerizing)